ncbi:methyltransferase domain-containing protein [Altererythrobacter xixiisoli]|uniref:Methyltransferase domain-containing protein n=1 Tax=Croceibacterium xixiisoli TaxID=1476466 RepID=A0A6I4TX63_9SPHN|nr:class I SAM-dependent methyltransferase [Croceibacterium xixiisoli]MXO98913.1 methyltransferase domain-containing protein [Croceibacterium xixiisoli]
MALAHDWRGKTGDSWAAEWRRTDRSFHALTAELLRRASAHPFTQALEIGSGAGELAIALADRSPQAQIIGVDLSDSLTQTAIARAPANANLAFVAADATLWQAPDGFAPQLLLSRHGVMFFDDPVAAFRHFHDLAAPRARLLFSCFRSPAESPFFADVDALLPNPAISADPLAPGPFAFADPARIELILGASGWRDVTITPFDFAMIAGAGEDPVADAMDYYTSIGPAARSMAALDDAAKQALRAQLRHYAHANLHGGQISAAAAIWIVEAQKG